MAIMPISMITLGHSFRRLSYPPFCFKRKAICTPAAPAPTMAMLCDVFLGPGIRHGTSPSPLATANKVIAAMHLKILK